LWPPDKLEWQVAALRERPDAVVVYGRATSVNGEGTPIQPPAGSDGKSPHWLEQGPGGNVYEKFLRHNYLVSPGQALVRRSALTAVGRDAVFDSTIPGCDDWDLWLRLAKVGSFESSPLAALRYRLHEGNDSRNLVKMMGGTLKLWSKHRHFATDPEVHRCLGRWLIRGRCALAEILIKSDRDTNPRTPLRTRLKRRLLLLWQVYRLEPRLIHTHYPGVSQLYWAFYARAPKAVKSLLNKTHAPSDDEHLCVNGSSGNLD